MNRPLEPQTWCLESIIDAMLDGEPDVPKTYAEIRDGIFHYAAWWGKKDCLELKITAIKNPIELKWKPPTKDERWMKPKWNVRTEESEHSVAFSFVAD